MIGQVDQILRPKYRLKLPSNYRRILRPHLKRLDRPDVAEYRMPHVRFELQVLGKMLRHLLIALLLGSLPFICLSDEGGAADLSIGRNAYLSGDFQTAIRLMGRAIDKGLSKADSANAYGIRGLAYENLGAIDQALDDFNQVLRLDPDKVAGHTNRGNILVKKLQYDQALKDYGEAIRLDPRESPALIGRSVVYARQRRFAEALEDLDAALRVNPQSYQAVLNKGWVHFCMGLFDQSASDYTLAMDMSKGNARALIGRGRALYFLGSFQPAADDFRKAVDLTQDPYGIIWLKLADLHLGSGAGTSAVPEEIKVAGWPSPIIDFLQGRASRKQLLAAAERETKAEQKAVQECEMRTYLGEFDLATSQPESSRQLLSKAEQSCPSSLVEREIARLELLNFGHQRR